MNASSSTFFSLILLLSVLTDINGYLLGRILPGTDDTEFATYRLRDDATFRVVRETPRKYNQNCFFTPMNCEIGRNHNGALTVGKASKRMRRVMLAV